MNPRNKEEIFDLNDSLLRDYPEMNALSGMPKKPAPKDAFSVSTAYSNLRSVERCLPCVEAGRQTIGIEYGLQLVGKCLDNLTATGKYEGFVSAERQKFDQLSRKASEVIGNKVRIGDIYR